jgi:luciferase family oxidoreductase group 1
VRLSVLELAPLRTDQSSRDVLAVSIRLPEAADRLGYTRFWTAEHHNTSAMASTNPAVMIAYLAARTTRIRLGSGGVMLPNHAPLVVAEQFALLEAVVPGRIDLGNGRATTAALRGRGADTAAPDSFAQDIDEVAALMTAQGSQQQQGEDRGNLTATPAAISAPPIWLLGSSVSSAQLAAVKGLPYVYANHFGKGDRAGGACALPRTIRPKQPSSGADDDPDGHRQCRAHPCGSRGVDVAADTVVQQGRHPHALLGRGVAISQSSFRDFSTNLSPMVR